MKILLLLCLVGQFGQPTEIALPVVESSELFDVLHDPRTIWYTSATIVPAKQEPRGGLNDTQVTFRKIGESLLPGTDPNTAFPWAHPAGTDRSPNVFGFRFLRLPADRTTGKPRPIVYVRRRERGSASGRAIPTYRWFFPVGTITGEVLTHRSPTGRLIPFELRSRIRERGSYSASVFRPFRTARELRRRIVQFRPRSRPPGIVSTLTWTSSSRTFSGPITRVTVRSTDGGREFSRTIYYDVLPPIGDDQLVTELLASTPFRETLGEVWRTAASRTKPGGGEVQAASYTSRAGWHIAPVRYRGGIVGESSFDCDSCHLAAGNLPKNVQTWTGRIRGDDGVLSFHPFEASSFGTVPRIRGEFAELFVPYDSRKHPRSLYHKLRK